MIANTCFADVTSCNANMHLIVLNGVEGASDLDGHRRLYLDAALNEFYEVPDAAILHCIKVHTSAANPLASSFLWLKADAKLIHHVSS